MRIAYVLKLDVREPLIRRVVIGKEYVRFDFWFYVYFYVKDAMIPCKVAEY